MMMDGLTLHQLFCLVAVVSEGGFQAAAEKLLRSQPVVSWITAKMCWFSNSAAKRPVTALFVFNVCCLSRLHCAEAPTDPKRSQMKINRSEVMRACPVEGAIGSE
jgi:hypothetical protein